MGWKRRGVISLSGNAEKPGGEDAPEEQATFSLRVVATERLGIPGDDFSCGAFFVNPEEPALAAWDWESGPPPVSLATGSDCVLVARTHPAVPRGYCAVDAVGRLNLHVESNETTTFAVHEPPAGQKTSLAELELEVRLVRDQSADADAVPPPTNGGSAQPPPPPQQQQQQQRATKPVAAAVRPDGGVSADARDLVRALQRACLGQTLSVNQLGIFRCAGAPGCALRVRIVQTDTLDAEERDSAVSYHCFRGVLTPETEVYITVDSTKGRQDGPSQPPAPAPAAAATTNGVAGAAAAAAPADQDATIASQLATLDSVIALKKREAGALAEMAAKEAAGASKGGAKAGAAAAAEKAARLAAAARAAADGVAHLEMQRRQLSDMRDRIAQIKSLKDSLSKASPLPEPADRAAAGEMAEVVRDLRSKLSADPSADTAMKALEMARLLIVRQLAGEGGGAGGGNASAALGAAAAASAGGAAAPSAAAGAGLGAGAAAKALSGELALANQRPRPPPGPSRQKVVVNCNDGEYFEVHRQLLRPCIALTKSVRGAGAGGADASADTAGKSGQQCSIDVGCLTFDRVLLFLEAEAAGRAPPEFDIRHMDDLGAAADALGLRSLKEYVLRRTGEFLSRLREYSLEEITQRNAAGECLLIVDGMVLDVTRWLPEHPGGSTIIPGQALGIDSATYFELYHASRESFLYLKHFYIGELSADAFDKLPPLDPPPSAAFMQQLQQHTGQFRLPVARNGARFKSF